MKFLVSLPVFVLVAVIVVGQDLKGDLVEQDVDKKEASPTGHGKVNKVSSINNAKTPGGSCPKITCPKTNCPRTTCPGHHSTCPFGTGVPVEIGSIESGKFTITGHAGFDIQWKYVQNEVIVACTKNTTAAGKESDYTQQYICRTYLKSSWVLGKLALDNSSCNFTCDLGTGYKVMRIPIKNDKNTQLLMLPQSHFEWIPLTSANIEEIDIISGGATTDGDAVPACRHLDGNGSAFVGKLFPGRGICFYVSGTEEFQQANNVEVLTLRRRVQTQAVTTVKGNACDKRFHECPVDLGIPAEFAHPIRGFSRDPEVTPGREWRYIEISELESCLNSSATDNAENNIQRYECRSNYDRRFRRNYHVRSGFIEFDESLCKFFCNFGNERATLEKITSHPEFQYQVPLPTLSNESKSCQSTTCLIGKREPVEISSYKSGNLSYSGLAESDVQWRYVFGHEVLPCISQTSVAGREHGHLPQYICRHRNTNKLSLWNLGKITFNESSCDFTCDIPLLSTVVKTPVLSDMNTQILMIPPMTQCWRDFNSPEELSNIVDAGWLICRVRRRHYNFIGQFDIFRNECYIPDGNIVHIYSNESRIEILTVNQDKDKYCPYQYGSYLEYGRRDESTNNSFKVTGIAHNETDLKWITVDRNDVRVCIGETTAAGNGQDSGAQYVCRAKDGKSLLLGRISYDERTCNFTCNVGWDLVAKKYPIQEGSKVQLLMYKPNAVRWVRVRDPSKPPVKMIKGGLNILGNPAPICRYTADANFTYVGKLALNFMYCWYLKDDKHYYANVSETRVEVLVLRR